MSYRSWRVLLGVAFLLVGFGFSQSFYALLAGQGYVTYANVALFVCNGVGVFGFVVCIYFAVRGDVEDE